MMTSFPLRGRSRLLLAVAATLVCVERPALAKDEFQMPREVTPAIRAACETDVRRLCIGEDPSVEKVKICVMTKFFKLNKHCQLRLVAAGFSP